MGVGNKKPNFPNFWFEYFKTVVCGRQLFPNDNRGLINYVVDSDSEKK